jgi:hypothetical protein
MNWRVEFRPEVESDMAEAARWYESQQAGLGAEFVEEIIQVWDALAENPLLNARRHPRKNIRWRYRAVTGHGSRMVASGWSLENRPRAAGVPHSLASSLK